MALHLPEPSVQSNITKRSVSLSFIERRLNRLTTSRRATESSEDMKGPLGLSILYEPSEPLIDFIFVHGLAGGSRKTWSSSRDPAQFWPKEWLPSEIGFKHVRIHSYGYNSDWGGQKQSVLNIHDFGQALLADIHNSPYMRRNSKTLIVLIAHSMGGLVIKKAYLLATQDPIYQQISKRIHSMFFLASPHHGADSAKLLSSLLRISVAHNPKSYVDELIPNSGTIQVINDQFRHVHQNVQLWSFFETIKTSFGYTQELIVKKDSAILGLPGEHIQLLNADHRHVCKFENSSDPNYITLRNAFITIIDDIDKDATFSRNDERRVQMKLISEYIGISQRPDMDLMAATDKKMNGTCVWLTDRPSFRDWFDGPTENDLFDPLMPDVPKIFWLNGKPGIGKSTTAGYVIRYLEDCNCDCSFYFFKYSDKARSSVSVLLRSLAYQMAYINFEIRQTILSMIGEGENFDKDDYNAIWRAFFLTRICRTQFRRPHYWVIDALDECNDIAVLFQLLSKIDKKIPLRVFTTSRPSSSIQKLFLQFKIPVFEEQVRIEDSLEDIKLFLQAHAHSLPAQDEAACNDLIAQILQNCNGCFLWAAIALRELEKIHSVEQIQDVLKLVPAEMDDLYTQILDGISVVPSNVVLAKSILRWIVCAVRPLKTEELIEALRLDINHNIPHLENAIKFICGNLVYVDSQSRVQTIHQTVATFLTRQGLDSEFAIDKRKENSRLAEICLVYLSGKELEAPRMRRGKVVMRPTKRSAFVDYASLHFSEHLANSAIDTSSFLLDSFLKSNILTWIEIVAETGDLSYLTRTAENFRTYIDRKPKLDTNVQTIEAWANDIIRLGAAFGRSLLASPASIHFVTAPVCPHSSAIYKNFAVYPRCLKVVGISDEEWDDRLLSINYSANQALSISCRDGYFAVGLSDGSIILYHSTTFETIRKFNHEEPVRHLAFAKMNSLLASSGLRKIQLWNIKTGIQLWAVDIRVHLYPMALSFNEDNSIIMLASKENHIEFFQVIDGVKLDDCPFYDTFGDEVEDEYRHLPWGAQFSSELNLLAISYRNRPITIWDLEIKGFLGQFQKEGSEDVYPAPQCNHVAFNPNPDLSLVAAAFNDGDLVIFDPWSLSQTALFKTAVHVLAASPDGRTLATGDTHGTINLFDFETLRLICHITAYDYDVRAIVFASNSLRFFDIRGNHCNAWEPSVLVRKDSSDECSSQPHSEEMPPSALFVQSKIWDEDRTITVIINHHLDNFLFCGREDGSIALYDAKTGKVAQELCHHAKMIAIRFLSWNPHSGILVSADTSSRFIARKFHQTAEGAWRTETPTLNNRTSQAIVQILTNPTGTQLLISTPSHNEIWPLDGGGGHHQIAEHKHNLPTSTTAQHRLARTWINHPSNSAHLLLFETQKIYIYAWSPFRRISRDEGISLVVDNNNNQHSFHSLHINPQSPQSPRFLIKDVFVSDRGHKICLRVVKDRDDDGDSVAGFFTLDARKVGLGAEMICMEGDYVYDDDDDGDHLVVTKEIKAIVGGYKSLVLFLDVDGWVCSLDLSSSPLSSSPPLPSPTKHFLIPLPWHAFGDLVFETTSKGSVVFARREEIVVFSGWG